MLNAIAGVGMISVGTLGNPAIGALQDDAFTRELQQADPVLAEQVITTRPGLFGESSSLDAVRRTAMADELASGPAGPRAEELQSQLGLIAEIDSRTKQGTLAKIAILPAIMFLAYVALILYFRSTGGYQAKAIAHGGESGH